MTRRADLPKPTPVGLRREDAAAYVGLSPNKFDEAVAKGEMPKPRIICGVKVWPIRLLAEALDPVEHALDPTQDEEKSIVQWFK